MGNVCLPFFRSLTGYHGVHLSSQQVAKQRADRTVVKSKASGGSAAYTCANQFWSSQSKLGTHSHDAGRRRGVTVPVKGTGKNTPRSRRRNPCQNLDYLGVILVRGHYRDSKGDYLQLGLESRL